MPSESPSMDGMKRPSPVKKPDLRPDHDLPAPEQPHLLEDKVADVSLPPEMPPIQEPETPKNKRFNLRKWLLIGLITVLLSIITAIGAAFVWYQQQLAPVSSDASNHVRITIEPGTSPSAIGNLLKESGLIRNKLAFTVYTKLSGTENMLKAGIYNLQPSISTPSIVDHLVKGEQDTFSVTFLPGETLADSRQTLIDLGYEASDVDKAFNKSYEGTLFQSKPLGTDLEGYIYGETIEFNASASVEEILQQFFDLYEDVITENNLVQAYQKQGLSLYEGITLASIIQREVPGPADQSQIAKVFLNRMQAGMTLGSDVTYQYAARKMGVDPTPTLQSPYNTRIHAGLPPGPIASPGKSALLAVANPGENDYLFFLSGDDDVTYFGRTDEEHQQNIVQHCKQKCLIN
jgi:UPF0755 protein